MADVSYSKNAAAKPAAAEPAATLLRRWMPSRERWLGIATIVAFIAIWEIVYRLGLMPKWAFPSPWKVVLAFQELIANGKLLTNTAASVGRQITGVFLAAVVGIDGARTVEDGNAGLEGEAGAWPHLRLELRRQGDGNAGADQGARTG